MLSRALSLATVTLVIGCLAAIPVRAQNLEAGKSPSQIFSGTCTACHKAPRGLLKTMSPGSLPGFLRQHYTTSSEMASQLSAFLLAHGATDTRGSKPAQQAKDARQPAPPQEATKPEGEPQQAAKRDGIAPGPDGRKSAAKQKLSKRGKAGSDEVDAAKDAPTKSEATKEDTSKSETGKETAEEAAKATAKEGAKETAKETAKEAAPDDATKPSGEGKSDTAKIDAPKQNGETPALRPDPVPPVTPAPPSMSAAVSNGTSEPSAAPEPPLMMLPPPPPALTASGPPLPPVPPAGPPAPPISR